MRSTRSTRSYWTLLLLLGGLVFLPACATTGSGNGSYDRDVLTREDLARMDNVSAYDAIRRLRPVWLRTERGQDSFDSQSLRGARVYLDGVNIGNVEALRDISAQNVEEIRFLDKRKATTQFGMDHAEGAILVRTRS